MSILNKLTEGIVQRDVSKEGAAILAKWENTGLLEGLGDERKKNTMAVLLENQAKELLREASSMQAGDVEGFAAVAFPIVRRVFGGLIANDLVSVQPMSLPSGLIFFLDFVHESKRNGDQAGESVYGGLDRGADTPAVGKDIASGVDLVSTDGRGPGGFYNLGGSARTSATGSVRFDVDDGITSTTPDVLGTPGVLIGGDFTKANLTGSKSGAQGTIFLDKSITEAQKAALRYDPDLMALGVSTLASGSATHRAFTVSIPKSSINTKLTGSSSSKTLTCDYDNLTAFSASLMPLGDGGDLKHIRRLTRVHPHNNNVLLLTFVGRTAKFENWIHNVAADNTGVGHVASALSGGFALNVPIRDEFIAGGAIGAVVGDELWGLEGAGDGTAGLGVRQNKIPEIDIKVDSVAVTAPVSYTHLTLPTIYSV